MATSMNTNSQQAKTTVGLLLIVGEIISNNQREDLCLSLQRAFQHIDNNKFHEIDDIFSHLIHENEFQADAQYRQIASTENGSIAGFLYLPNFHTVSNVLKDFFNLCSHVCIIFCGQQIDSNGALVLSDSLFTCDNFYGLFEENPSSIIQDLQIILPFISQQWNRLATNYLQKHLHNIQLNDLSNEILEEEFFGDLFFDRLYDVLNKDSINFDIYTKLIPRDSSGTIAFDEPNLYILYGQQGEASLFGIRGFVVLINGGFSRFPSYWNLIRGLQNIDACILTHFDYDVFPGLQTILHRKSIPSPLDGQLCKPDIGAIFLNHTQRSKLQSIPSTKASNTNSNLLVNLNENIDQFLNTIKELNIDTFNLVKRTIQNKAVIEPTNLYKKIAFGSLDLYTLHPTTSTSEDERMVTGLQKIPIRNHQPSSSIIPIHHWYSSCSLLVWTPTSKSNKDRIVRILYTGACPQTLVFEALGRAGHLDLLHEHPSQRTESTKTTSSTKTSVSAKPPLQKPRVIPEIPKRLTSTITQNKTPKVAPRPVVSKPKAPQTTTTKSDKPRPAPMPKKAPVPVKTTPTRSVSKEKKTQKPSPSPAKPSTKPKERQKPVQKLKTPDVKKPKVKVQNGRKEKPKTRADQAKKKETPVEHRTELTSETIHEENAEDIISGGEEQLETGVNHAENLETATDNEEKSEAAMENQEESNNNNEHNLQSDIDYEQKSETAVENEEQLNNAEEHNGESDAEYEQKSETGIEKEEPNNDNEHTRESDVDYEQKAETTIENEEQPNNDDEHNQESDAEYERKFETEIDEAQKSDPQTDEAEQNNSFFNDIDEPPGEKSEPEMSADELDENNERSTDHHEDEDQRPEAISLSNGHDKPLIESNTSSPMEEIKSPSNLHDPMTMGFVEGASDTENPFTDQTKDHNENDDEMEIIQHDIATSKKYSIPSDDDIDAQFLPIETNTHPKKSNGPTKSSTSALKSKQTSSGAIFYVDVAYIPYHGNEHYVDSEFFRRIRARYYILNAVQINPRTLESLIDGKQQWGNKEHIPITLIPTFDGEQLRQFFVTNKNRLAELNITILPASTRCNVQYDDEGSPAQRLRFNSTHNSDE